VKASEDQSRGIIPKKKNLLSTVSSNLIRRGLDRANLLHASSKIHIMIVDDIIETRVNIRKLLQFEEDIEVIADTGSSLEAIEIFKDKRPNIILQDIHRPEMDGFKFAEKVRYVDPLAKVLILSVSGGSLWAIRRGVEDGIMGSMAKPPDGDELIGLIRTIHHAKDHLYFYHDSWIGKSSYYIIGDTFDILTKLDPIKGRKFVRTAGALIEIESWQRHPIEKETVGAFDFVAIKRLDVNDHHINHIDFELITRMVNLSSLSIPESLIDPNDINYLVHHFPRIQYLTIGKRHYDLGNRSFYPSGFNY